MFNPFDWMRKLAKAAVINGVADALTDLAPEGQEPPADLGELQQRLAASARVPALPAAEAGEGDDEPAAVVASKPAKRK
jgi:hypothetical protein